MVDASSVTHQRPDRQPDVRTHTVITLVRTETATKYLNTSECLATKCCPDSHGPQRGNPKEYGEPLIFPLEPQQG